MQFSVENTGVNEQLAQFFFGLIFTDVLEFLILGKVVFFECLRIGRAVFLQFGNCPF
jgi:hypothetical protein